MANTSNLLQILEIFSCASTMKEATVPRLQDSTSIRYKHGQRKYKQGNLCGFRYCRAVANSLELKSAEKLTGLVVAALQSSSTSLEISQDDL